MARTKKRNKRESIVRQGNVGSKITAIEKEDGMFSFRFSLAVNEDSQGEPTWYTCFAHGDGAQRVIGLVPNPAGGDYLELPPIEAGMRVEVRGLYELGKDANGESQPLINIYRASGINEVRPMKWSRKALARARALHKKNKKK